MECLGLEPGWQDGRRRRIHWPIIKNFKGRASQHRRHVHQHQRSLWQPRRRWRLRWGHQHGHLVARKQNLGYGEWYYYIFFFNLVVVGFVFFTWKPPMVEPNSLLFFNGPSPSSFSCFQTSYKIATKGFSSIWIRIVWVDGERHHSPKWYYKIISTLSENVSFF